MERQSFFGGDADRRIHQLLEKETSSTLPFKDSLMSSRIRLLVVVKSLALFLLSLLRVFGIFGDVLERKLFVVLQHHDGEFIDIARKEEDIDVVLSCTSQAAAGA
jgi:hypothetical protein